MKTNAFLLAILAIALAAGGCVKVNPAAVNKEPLSLSEVGTASQVSPDGQPLAASNNFLASTPTIYVTARLANAPEGTQAGVKWYYVQDESGNTVNQLLNEETITAAGSRYISFSRQPVTGTWGSGKYSASLLLNGREVATAGFSVRPVLQAAAQAPTIGYFKAVPDSISAGQAVTLSWATTGASKTEISTIGSVPATGNSLVTPTNDAEYELAASNSAGTTKLKLKVSVTNIARDKPDLVITGFGVDGDRAWYRIKNIGAIEAKQNTTMLYVQGERRASSLAELLPAGEERKVYFNNYSWGYGANRSYTLPVRICADGMDVVGEYDENNNCLVVDW